MTKKVLCALGGLFLLGAIGVGVFFVSNHTAVAEFLGGGSETASNLRPEYDVSVEDKSIRKTLQGGETIRSANNYTTNEEQIVLTLRAEEEDTVVTVELYTTDTKKRDSQTKTLSTGEDTEFLFPKLDSGDLYYFYYTNESDHEATIVGKASA